MDHPEAANFNAQSIPLLHEPDRLQFVMSYTDPQLIGWWKVQSIVMPEGKTLGLIGGLPGERVCFSETGHYNVFPDDDDTQCFRCRNSHPFRELDIWIQGLEPLTSYCVYTIDGDVLKITVAGRPLGGDPKAITRPTDMGMDKQRNWALIEMKRCKAPRTRGKKQPGWNLKPGRFIPDGFLDD